MAAEKTMDKIVALCKGRGFVYPGSEIYGGLANTWDYGPLGVELKNNIKRAWQKKFVQECPYNVGLDIRYPYEPPDMGGFRSHRRLLRPSYGLQGAARPATVRTSSLRTLTARERCRLDNSADARRTSTSMNITVLPSCGKPRILPISVKFNLMFKTFQGVTEDCKSEPLPPSRNRSGYFRKLQQHCSAPHVKRFLSALAR